MHQTRTKKKKKKAHTHNAVGRENTKGGGGGINCVPSLDVFVVIELLVLGKTLLAAEGYTEQSWSLA